jgi:hypothetical protein
MPNIILNETINQTANATAANISKITDKATQGDIFTMLWGILTNPVTIFLTGILFGGIAILLVYKWFKGKDENIFEFEKFEDTTKEDIQKNFKLEGKGTRSKAKLIHGFQNPIGNVEKWLSKKGEWQLLKFNESTQKFESVMQDVQIDTGKKDKKNKSIIKTEKKPVKKSYDLKLFKVSEGWFIFKTIYHVLADTKYLHFDPLARIWDISENVPLRSYGGVWITSESGQIFLDDISFRRSLENNMTFLQNYSRKIIFLETNFVKREQLLTAKGVAKKLQYDNYSKNVLMEAGELESSETEDTT